MEFIEFSQKLEDLLKSMNTGTEVCLRKVLKNNGVEKTAVNILPAGAECAPNIYLEPVYGMFEKMGLSLDQAGEYVMYLHKKTMAQIESGFLLKEEIKDFEKVRGRLTLRMVNREKNQKMLGEVVSLPFLDLAGVFYVAEDMETMDVVIRVSQELMSCWDVDRDELEKTALDNLRKKGNFCLRDICEVIASSGEEQVRFSGRGEPYMYVLTDISMRNGPAAFLLPEILSRYADELGGDLLLLPSSINELIVLRDRRSDYAELKRIVGEINASIVDPEEILGNSVYKYSRRQSEVTVAA